MPLGFLAAADRGEFGGDGAEVAEGAADLDEAVVRLVDGLGVLEGIVVVGSWSTSLGAGRDGRAARPGKVLASGRHSSRRPAWRHPTASRTPRH